AIKGRTARTSAIDLDVRVEKQTATIRDGAAVARASVPNPAFTMAGYAPVAAQLVLMRYWVSHGKPASIPLLPHGAARIEPRGRDAVDVNGQKISFDRYSVGGVIWGRESLWCDDAGRLAALVSVDAEFDHFEAVRPDLAAGVPTVRDVGNELDFIAAVRDAVAEGRGLGPRLLLAGLIDGEGPNGLGVARAATPEEGRRWVDRYHNARFDQIKIYSSIRMDVLRAITDEAHRLGLTVTGHVPAGMNALDAIDAGLDQINHREYVAAVMRPNPDAAIAAFRRRGAVVDPTLALYELLARPFTQPIEAFEPG